MTSIAAASRYRFTAADVHRMLEAGILPEGPGIELLDGELVQMTAQGPLHRIAKDLLTERLVLAYAGKAYVSEQSPLDASEHSQPEPDLAVYRGVARDYRQGHPRGADALLVIEVAYTSQDVDHEKAALYAAAGVPVYWILDLVARRLEIHEGPHGSSYARVTSLDDTGTVTPPGLDVVWKIADLLP